VISLLENKPPLYRRACDIFNPSQVLANLQMVPPLVRKCLSYYVRTTASFSNSVSSDGRHACMTAEASLASTQFEPRWFGQGGLARMVPTQKVKLQKNGFKLLEGDDIAKSPG